MCGLGLGFKVRGGEFKGDVRVRARVQGERGKESGQEKLRELVM